MTAQNCDVTNQLISLEKGGGGNILTRTLPFFPFKGISCWDSFFVVVVFCVCLFSFFVSLLSCNSIINIAG